MIVTVGATRGRTVNLMPVGVFGASSIQSTLSARGEKNSG